MLTQWQTLFSSWLDVVGFAFFLIAFPIYHSAYPWLMRLFPNRAAKVRLDEFRRSWIERLVHTRDLIAAAQQTRNLAMVNSLLASSALILMGFTANVLLGMPGTMSPNGAEDATTRADAAAGTESLTGLVQWAADPDSLQLKLLLLILVFGVSFAYSMTALRHLGHFNLVIGADPEVIASREGSAVDYLGALINKASNRATLAVRCLYSATPLFLWLFDTRLFVLVTVVWLAKFVAFQDFAHLRRSSPALPKSEPAATEGDEPS
jgi:uncharacterized membrane protein